jgi:hypothetical protein
MKRIGYVLALTMIMLGLLLFCRSGTQASETQNRVNVPSPLAPIAPQLPAHPLGTTRDASDNSDTQKTLDGGASIQSTNLISIPYGFDTPLPVLNEGRDVIASGHGACTDDQQVTVAVTVTQSSTGAVAIGEIVQTCTGELQTWSAWTTIDTSTLFVSDPGEACGLATTQENGYVTDTYDWCKPVDLIRLDSRVYLPITLVP